MRSEERGELRIDGDKLRLIMKRQRMTNVSLADAMGMHRNGILRILREESTSLATLEGLCNTLRCNPLDLLVWDGFSPVDPNSEALAALLSRVGVTDRVAVVS